MLYVAKEKKRRINEWMDAMRKFGVLTTTIFLSILLAGCYGMLHDQVTYSISPEYFTKFKYRQFGFDPVWFGGHRQTVAVIGFLATWWVGLAIGLILGFTALIFRDHRLMRRAITRAIAFVFLTAIVFSFAGFLWGKYRLVQTGVDWWLPSDLRDQDSFIIVGSVHNFSYLGGVAGLLTGVIYLCWKYDAIRKRSNTFPVSHPGPMK